MTTEQEIKKAAESVITTSVRGVFRLEPSLTLIHLPSGKRVTARHLDTRSGWRAVFITQINAWLSLDEVEIPK